MPVILAYEKLRQKDQLFQDSLGFRSLFKKKKEPACLSGRHQSSPSAMSLCSSHSQDLPWLQTENGLPGTLCLPTLFVPVLMSAVSISALCASWI